MSVLSAYSESTGVSPRRVVLSDLSQPVCDRTEGYYLEDHCFKYYVRSLAKFTLLELHYTFCIYFYNSKMIVALISHNYYLR